MGKTAGGLPYPEDNAPVADGALGVKALATALDQPPRGRATQTAAQNIPTGTATTTVANLVADYAEGITFNNNGFAIIQPGLYLVTLQISYASNPTGIRSARCMRNGSLVPYAFAQTAAGNNTEHMLYSVEVEFAANDALTLGAVQTSGAVVATVPQYTSLALRLVAGPVAG